MAGSRPSDLMEGVAWSNTRNEEMGIIVTITYQCPDNVLQASRPANINSQMVLKVGGKAVTRTD